MTPWEAKRGDSDGRVGAPTDRLDAVFHSQCPVGGSSGTIGTAVELSFGSVVGDRDRCRCISDILLTKVRD